MRRYLIPRVKESQTLKEPTRTASRFVPSYKHKKSDQMLEWSIQENQSENFLHPRMCETILTAHRKPRGLNTRQSCRVHNKTATSLHAIGIWWEDVVVNSLAIKYYLVKLSKERIVLSDLYDFEYNTFINIAIDLGNKIVLNEVEMNVNDFAAAALFHQKNIKDAHYDFLCPQLSDQNFGLLPAQCKNTLNMSKTLTLEKQLEGCEHLLWIYPGYKSGDDNSLLYSNSHLVKKAVANNKIIFLNGYGCCCTLTVDMIILLKNAFKQ
ncbi:hypothetical protein O9G_005539 [Rozella allomycis CSF55]|uniref:Uncharacterized protein n=1 Tax=Rozella allomycis (strain CSF55) TaxID=988480 RepID=A0A075AVF3_ROZAC|nr:hypothetical protein O9G_005539 [Rozella allomycis CSF55]|eukprot:EPZ32682.1 hypothetical protein O9G_005539 [Rozella allomycis CSF55]